MISIQRVSRGKEPEKATEAKEQSSKPKTPREQSSNCACTQGRLRSMGTEKRIVPFRVRKSNFSGILGVEAKLKWVQE